MNDGRKKKGQKYQNKTEFKIQFNPLALQTHKKVSLRGLCKRCSDQIVWKQKYNKYKKMTEPAKCTFCHQKNVLRTYMRACEKCVEQRNVCPKCLQALTEQQIQTKLNEVQQKKKQQQEEHKMNEFVKTLKERSRRTVKRLFDKGTITWNNDMQTFVDEEGNSLALQFRQGYGSNVSNSGGSQEEDIDELESDQDELDEEEETKQKVTKTKQTKQYMPKIKKTKEEKLIQQKQQEESQQNDEDASQQQEAQETTADKQQKAKQTHNRSKQPLSQEASQQQAEDDEQDTSPIIENQPIPLGKPGQQQQADWQDVEQDSEGIQQKPCLKECVARCCPPKKGHR